MNSTIRLYYGNAERPWELFEERNFIIEDIADYLKQYPYLERQDFMHQKLHLDMSIKVDIGQEYMNPLYETAIRYVSITPDEEDKTYYFYVEECNWLSRKAVQLSIHMDTLNTFKYNSYENGYILSGGTHITRQHKNRYTGGSTTANGYKKCIFTITDENVITMVQSAVTNHNSAGYYTGKNPFTLEITECGLFGIWFTDSGTASFKIYANWSGTSCYIISLEIDIEDFDFTPEIIEKMTSAQSCYFDISYKFYNGSDFINNYTILSGTYSFDFENEYIISTYFQRYIDYYPEQLDIPLYLTNEEVVVDKTYNDNWYLIIANQNDPDESTQNPVNYLICCDNNILVSGINYSGDRFVISPDDMEEGTTYYLWFNNKEYATYLLVEQWASELEYYVLNSSNITNTILTVTKTSSTELTLSFSYNEKATSKPIGEVTVSSVEWLAPLVISYSTTKNGSRATWTKTVSGTLTPGTAVELTSFNEIDRTDSKLIKAILLPYRPCNLTVVNKVNNEYTFNENDYEEFDYTNVGSNQLHLLRVLTDDLTATIETSIDDPLNDTLTELNMSKDDLFSVATGSNSYIIESKMFNSDFYYKKLVYDSFNFSYHLEMLIPAEDFSNFVFDFTVTKTGNSRFIFTYNIPWKFADIDYPLVMAVSRNNEMPLFNNAYLDYVRTGYNYDVKNKTLHNTNDWVTLFTSGIRSQAQVGELVDWGKSYHGPRAQTNVAYNSFYQGAISKGVSSTINMIGGAISNALQMQIRENNLQKNVIEKQWQTSSIYGSDDVDLLKKYTGNRMKMVTYEINEQFKKLVLALFHYTGYKCNEFGVPDVSTRTRFNYVQADIVLDSMMNFSSEIREELINRWAGGVYFIHHYNDEWDCQLKYENYEVSLEEYIEEE